MKILNFTYTKESGETSNRVFMPIFVPTQNYFGVDLTELDDEQVVEFALEYESALQDFEMQVQKILAKHDLKRNYRNFNPNNMTDVETDEV